MAGKSKKKTTKENIKKRTKTEVIAKLIEALKEYKTPESDKKLTKEIEKAAKAITRLVLKSKKDVTPASEKKIA